MLQFEEEGHKYIWDGLRVPSVTQILENVGISDFSNVPESILNNSINFGLAVHKMCELYDRGMLEMKSLDPQLLPVLGQWQKFLKDYQVKLDPNFIEQAFYCSKFKYAGTPDRVCTIKDRNIVLDIKTGAVNPSHAIQLAAYQLGIAEEGLKIQGRWTIYLSAEKYKIEIYKKQSDFSVFLSALNIYNWKKNKGK